MASVLGKGTIGQWVIAIILILYIFSPVHTPHDLKALVDTSAGTLVVIVVAIAIFLNTNAVVGVLALVAGYELLRRSRRTESRSGHGLSPGNPLPPSVRPHEAVKTGDFIKYNHHTSTLEEEVVDKMAPLVKHAGPANIAYQPTLHPQHSAAPISFKGIL